MAESEDYYAKEREVFMNKLSKTLITLGLVAVLTGCNLPSIGGEQPNLDNGSVNENQNPSGNDPALYIPNDDGNDDVGVIDGNSSVSGYDIVGSTELKELEFKYWDVDNNNGIPYFFAHVYNPNDVTVDFGVYIDYSAGSNKSVSEEMYELMSTVGPKETIVLADLSGRPFPDTDSIEVRYDYLIQSMYTLVDTDFTVTENTEDEYGHHIEVTIAEEDFYYCDVYVLYYQSGDVSGFDFVTFYPGDDYSYDTSCVFNYDDYEVFVSAYKL